MNQGISSTSKCFIIPIIFLKVSGIPTLLYLLLNENTYSGTIYPVPLNIKIT